MSKSSNSDSQKSLPSPGHPSTGRPDLDLITDPLEEQRLEPQRDSHRSDTRGHPSTGRKSHNSTSAQSSVYNSRTDPENAAMDSDEELRKMMEGFVDDEESDPTYEPP
ncbi:Intraflagellar transport protein 46 homolog [Caenorhabditis elegans]|uniref:Intraflagellar transport protein 46 homolog n=1 Tax=Caenorhabditis elegans TaxID=6239 RepID=Q9N3B4_CAEEL|nr:Intraflagellar transport protein 46 homolog [Caenorhabditis elegans]CCD83507.1 Intraflagellar transport protein 46 homolog [Caenorhabditis elegans]|eukprot:NP_500268.1 Uncharacterized protein CELE_Y54G2A.19 [Caenorhabditis elegans]